MHEKEPKRELISYYYLYAETVVIFLFAMFVEFSDELSITSKASSVPKMRLIYPNFQDLHIMIFIGFGFLMVFLKSHMWTSVSQNFFVAAYCI